MHEMSIAEGILKIAVDVMEKNHCRKIRAIGLRLGEMSGVELEALNMAFDVLTRNSPAEGSELKIERVPIIGACNQCGKTFRVERYNFFCPECNGILILKSGRELQVAFVDVD